MHYGGKCVCRVASDLMWIFVLVPGGSRVIYLSEVDMVVYAYVIPTTMENSVKELNNEDADTSINHANAKYLWSHYLLHFSDWLWGGGGKWDPKIIENLFHCPGICGSKTKMMPLSGTLGTMNLPTNSSVDTEDLSILVQELRELGFDAIRFAFF